MCVCVCVCVWTEFRSAFGCMCACTRVCVLEFVYALCEHYVVATLVWWEWRCMAHDFGLKAHHTGSRNSRVCSMDGLSVQTAVNIHEIKH